MFEAPLPTTSTESSSSSHTQYEYTNLNYKLGQEIRLCVLLPGDSDNPLQCEIIHVNLEDEPYYEAVSYTWAGEDGDASLSRSIHCGSNRVIPITANCDTVLHQLRNCALRRRLWIDAVCINQANLNERSHQVGLMDRIYSKARSVRICIKDDAIPPEWHGYKESFRLLRDEHVCDVAKALQFLTRLLSLRYFKRVWVRS